MVEEQLKNLIIEKYGSLNKFSEAIAMPWTTLDGALKRGVNKTNITTLIKICNELGIDCESLYYGRLLPKRALLNEPALSNIELEYIKKYRSLDGNGKKRIDTLLDLEYEQVQQGLTVQDHHVSYTQLRYYEAGRPSAGLGNYLPEDIQAGTIMVQNTPLASKADFVLKVSGHSMSPLYEDGDLVLVKSQDDIDLDEIGIFVVDGEAFIKQRKTNYLHSLNPDYPDVMLSEDSNVKCFGKVLGKE